MKTASIALILMFAFVAAACGIQVGYYDDGFMVDSQSQAQLYAPPAGCESGPFSLAIINETDFYMSVTIDTEDIDFIAEDGAYAELFPMTTAFLCLEDTGEHLLTGQAYTPRYEELMAIEGDQGSFSWTGDFGITVAPSGRHEFKIQSSLLLYN